MIQDLRDCVLSVIELERLELDLNAMVSCLQCMILSFPTEVAREYTSNMRLQRVSRSLILQ